MLKSFCYNINQDWKGLVKVCDFLFNLCINFIFSLHKVLLFNLFSFQNISFSVPPFPVLRLWFPIWVSTGDFRGSPKLYLFMSGLKNIIYTNKLEKSSSLGKRMQVGTPNSCHLSEMVENFSHPNHLDDEHGVHKDLFHKKRKHRQLIICFNQLCFIVLSGFQFLNPIQAPLFAQNLSRQYWISCHVLLAIISVIFSFSSVMSRILITSARRWKSLS